MTTDQHPDLPPIVATIRAWHETDRGYAIVATDRTGAQTTISYASSHDDAEHTAAYLRGLLTDAYRAGQASAPLHGQVYAVAATISEHRDTAGWCRSRQVPTFYLSADAQGIVSTDHASRLAVDIIDPSGAIRVAGGAVNATAYPL
jgi:hypothetical protein